MTDSLTVRGACPHDCPDTCGMLTDVRDGRAVAVRGDPDHPVTRGWLCAKVRPYLGHVYHPGRLLHPLRRIGPKGSGQWQRVSWDDALAEIAGRWKAIIAKFRAEAILPYSYSGTLGLVQMTVASARFWNRLGASQLRRSICGAAAERAVEATLGARWSQPYADVVHSRLVILWGHNPIATAPHFLPFLQQARRNGCQVVVIDPRRTATAKQAHWHLAPRPGTDGVLAMGLAHLIVAAGRHDEAWLNAHTLGWPQLRERLAEFPPGPVAAETGLTEADVRRLADLYGTTRPGLIKIADGINRNRNGGQNVRAILALPAVTGQYGTRGGGLAYSTGGYAKWDRLAVHKVLPTTREVNMNRLGAALCGEVADPPVMSLFVFGANPATSSPNAGRIVEGLKRDDLFTVVHELFMTDTARYADLVLPATSQLEQADLHKAYGHTRLAFNAKAIEPLGESKSNWEVMGLLAGAMGFTEPWLHQTPDEVIDEVLTATAEGQPWFRGITLDRLKREGSVAFDLPDGPPFADGCFPTPSGKVELYCEALAAEGIDPLPGRFRPDRDDGGADGDGRWDPAAALELLSGASHHFVSSSLASQADLLKGAGPPFLEIHSDDAAARSVADGDEVVVENGRGWVRLKAVVTDGVRPGVVVSPKGRWASLSGGRNVNWTTPDALADLAGQSTFHSNRVWVRRAGPG
jgi:anaerobic selenocysteine-containing dehydrogenase